MPISNLTRIAALLGGVALFGPPALAADQLANDAGAKTIADFLAAYGGKAAAPSIKVQAQGSGYLVSFDLAAASAAMKSAGFVYDPAEIKLHVFQQDDGPWRAEIAGMPPISGRMTAPTPQGDAKIDVRVESENFKQTMLIDPKLGWIASSKGGVDKLSVTESGEGIREYIEFGQMKFDLATKSGSEGLTTAAAQPFGALSIVADFQHKRPDGSDSKPVRYAADGQNGEADVTLSNFQPAPLLDAWRFFAAHPERADLARDFDAMKGVVTALVADHFAVDETIKLDKLTLSTGAGPVAIEGASFAVGAINAGAATGFSEHFVAKSLKLPDTVLPPAYAAIAPTGFDIAFKATGFDIDAASREWLANAKLEGDGPIVSEEERRKISQMLIRGRPIAVEIEPSHISGPALDISLEGKATIDLGQPIGSITLKMRDFDKTATAIQGLGPDVSAQLLPMIAMAKGLGKPLADGSLLWVVDLGRDHVVKINGLPLGKSPF